MAGTASRSASPMCWPSTRRAGDRIRGLVVHVGRAGRHGAPGGGAGRPWRGRGRHHPAQPAGLHRLPPGGAFRRRLRRDHQPGTRPGSHPRRHRVVGPRGPGRRGGRSGRVGARRPAGDHGRGVGPRANRWSSPRDAAGTRTSANPERPETAVRMLTSGTTGPPKRVDLSYRMLERVLVGAKHYESNRDETVHLRRGVAIVNSPLVHLGGLFRVLQCVSDGRSFCLLERFHRGRLVRRSASPPPGDRQPRPGGLAHGPRGRSQSRRSVEHPLRRVGHGAARSRRCRRVHRQVRHSCADHVCGDRVRRGCRRLEPRRSQEVLGRQARQRRPRA
jgi:hypothetical protein